MTVKTRRWRLPPGVRVREIARATWPYEASLMRKPVANPERPLELLRTVHSFDPCMVCACHTFDPDGREIACVRVL